MHNKLHLLIGIILLTIIFVSTPGQAEEKHLQLALFTPIQLVPKEQSITGLSLNLIYSKNTSMIGVNAGLVTHLTSGLSQGIQSGLVGIAEEDFSGLQHNAVNITKGTIKGFQSGLVNSANQMRGIQFGLVNWAAHMDGFQLGLANIIKEGGQFPFFPIINWSK
ncbi:MAG: hypothetical protein KGY75_09160 [Candidatus Cloacimonetes bacterium]|nr:hypothetical protein [Candidatus Cloacimonadota bacterium]MBS3741727.1 hypothetical protein [Candidatus Cloacimonadota bacterium]MBS3768267.1 hypothetical protein [Candidatus Cloacimonadota bacterium]